MERSAVRRRGQDRRDVPEASQAANPGEPANPIINIDKPDWLAKHQGHE